MTVGIIGAGTISEYHIAALQKRNDVSVTAIHDVNQERSAGVAARFGIPTCCSSLPELLAIDAIDAVTVGVWNAAHADVTCAALRAGKHVFCEKPMARTLAEAEQMAAVEAESDRLLMIGLVRRFDLRSVVARSIIQEGRLGEIYLVRAGYLRRDGQPGGWFTSREKAGGGALLDIGIHSLDLGLSLAGLGPVAQVSGFTRQLGRIMEGVAGAQKYTSKDSAGVHDVEDHAFGSLSFSTGALMTIEASWAQHREEDTQYLEIYGTRGGLIVDPDLRLHTNQGGALSDAHFPLNETGDRLQNMFDAELSHFADCVHGTARCQSPSADGVRLMRLIEGIYESAGRGEPHRFDPAV